MAICPLRIICATSVPAKVASAEWKALKPIIALMPALIVLKDVVQMFCLGSIDLRALARDFQDDVDRLKSRKVGAAFVDDNAIRHAVTVDHFLEKPSCRRQVSPL